MALPRPAVVATAWTASAQKRHGEPPPIPCWVSEHWPWGATTPVPQAPIVDDHSAVPFRQLAVARSSRATGSPPDAHVAVREQDRAPPTLARGGRRNTLRRRAATAAIEGLAHGLREDVDAQHGPLSTGEELRHRPGPQPTSRVGPVQWSKSARSESPATPSPLPMQQWLGVAGDSDRALLDHCTGPTLDVGCGPGRMAEFLARGGRTVLGIDVLPEAVRQTLDRGVPALLRSVFDALPGEGRWGTVLLADGNIGIGGDPVALLERARQLTERDGRVVVDVGAWGTGVVTRQVSLETQHGRSGEFPWTTVGADAVQAVATAAGLGSATCYQRGDRIWAVVGGRP